MDVRLIRQRDGTWRALIDGYRVVALGVPDAPTIIDAMSDAVVALVEMNEGRADWPLP